MQRVEHVGRKRAGLLGLAACAAISGASARARAMQSAALALSVDERRSSIALPRSIGIVAAIGGSVNGDIAASALSPMAIAPELCDNALPSFRSAPRLEMGEFAIGQSVPRFEDPRLVKGAGRYVDDVRSRTCAAMCCARRTRMPAFAASTSGRAKATPGVHLILTGRDPEIRALGRPAGAAQAPRRLARRAPPQPALRRDIAHYVGDSGGVRGGGDAASGQGCGRGGRDRLRSAARGRNVEDAVKTGAPTVHEASPNNICSRSATRPRSTRVRGRRPRGQASHRDQPDHHQRNGAARLPRRVRSARRPLHLAAHGAGPARYPPRARERSAQSPGNQGASDFGECRRRLRHEGGGLQRVRAVLLASKLTAGR